MKVLYVDDEPLAVTRFEVMSKQLPEIEELHCFNRPSEAIAFVKENAVDTAFLDIEMPEMSGMELAGELNRINENIRVIFVTAYDQYAMDAFGVNALGYLLKPYSIDMVSKALDKARRMRDVPHKQVEIRTVPTFDVFIDGELFPITSPKPKELLALMVDHRGGSVTTGQAIAALWEDKPDDEKTKALYRMTLKRLKEILAAAGIGFILNTDGSAKFIKPDTFTCDSYRMLNGDKEALAKYNGEYMGEYSWAEETNALLYDLHEKLEE